MFTCVSCVRGSSPVYFLYNHIYRVRMLLSRAPYIAHCSLRRAHIARAAVPGLRPSQRRPSAGSPALRRAPSAGQCRPSAGHSVPQCRPSAGTPCPNAGQCRPSASTPCPQCKPVPAFGRALRAPVPAFGWRMGSSPQCTVALSATLTLQHHGAFVARILPPRSRKFGYGLLLDM